MWRNPTRQHPTRRGLVWLLAAALVLAVAGTVAVRPAVAHNSDDVEHRLEERFGFRDLDEAPWAQSYMTLLAAKGIFRGRGEGTLAPGAPVTRAEALTAAVRLALLADGTVSVDGSGGRPAVDAAVQSRYAGATGFRFAFTDADVLTRGAASWAAPYVYVAIQRGIIDNAAADLQPTAAADRAWVAQVLVRALAGRIQVDPARGAVRFTDTAGLPAEALAYIEAAVAAGLFQGYPDGSFRPQRGVTRAELMAVMARADDDLQVPGGNVYRGTIAGVSGTSVTVRLRGDDDGSAAPAATAAFRLTPGTVIFRRGQPATAAQLVAGDKVQVAAVQGPAGLDAAVIWASPTAAGFEVEFRAAVESVGVLSDGSTQLVVRLADGSLRAVAVPAGAEIRRSGDPVTIAAVQPGGFVEIKQLGGTVVRVTVQDHGFGTVQPGDDSPGDDSPGDDSPGGADDSLAPEAEALARLEAIGTGADGATYLTLTILGRVEGALPAGADLGGTSTWAVNPGAEVEIEGEEATLASLRPGDLIDVKWRGQVLVRVRVRLD